ncbi:hypothetical protein OIU77_016563 [Salix suchowensis]|uniref:Uncharacterized protein n=1 Tax=Salix suchowensis TaxID=1278906 RepID=A0ABQ8ZL06_9ROSI|nr:hypothetical protein OIU77_016563 [Salix suchowensis]
MKPVFQLVMIIKIILDRIIKRFKGHKVHRMDRIQRQQQNNTEIKIPEFKIPKWKSSSPSSQR